MERDAFGSDEDSCVNRMTGTAGNSVSDPVVASIGATTEDDDLSDGSARASPTRGRHSLKVRGGRKMRQQNMTTWR